MGRFTAVPYSGEMRKEWDAFNASSRNSTFLLDRGYMDYHSDRFRDASLVVKDSDGKISALFAASVEGGTVTAHGGLTYGGIVLPRRGINGADTVEAFKAIAAHYAAQGAERIVYKAIPHIYHALPSDDDIYALFRMGARLTEVDMSLAIDYHAAENTLDSNARRGAEKARKMGLRAAESRDFGPFWEILTDLLAGRYATRPVHTLEEIDLLAKRFPERIALWTVADADGEVLAGTVIYDTGIVAHTQYIASSPRGKEACALHLLFSELVGRYRGRVRYFDFGTSNEDHGMRLNEGLVRQKWGYGGRPVAHQIFTVELRGKI